VCVCESLPSSLYSLELVGSEGICRASTSTVLHSSKPNRHRPSAFAPLARAGSGLGVASSGWALVVAQLVARPGKSVSWLFSFRRCIFWYFVFLLFGVFCSYSTYILYMSCKINNLQYKCNYVNSKGKCV